MPEDSDALRIEWTPACAEERHSHDTNMQNTLGYQSAPRIGKKCSGENILGLVGLKQKGSGK